MRIEAIKDRISFKSGYPTFGADGHLKSRSNLEGHELVYFGYRPTERLNGMGQKLEYLA